MLVTFLKRVRVHAKSILCLKFIAENLFSSATLYICCWYPDNCPIMKNNMLRKRRFNIIREFSDFQQLHPEPMTITVSWHHKFIVENKKPSMELVLRYITWKEDKMGQNMRVHFKSTRIFCPITYKFNQQPAVSLAT